MNVVNHVTRKFLEISGHKVLFRCFNFSAGKDTGLIGLVVVVFVLNKDARNKSVVYTEAKKQVLCQHCEIPGTFLLMSVQTLCYKVFTLSNFLCTFRVKWQFLNIVSPILKCLPSRIFFNDLYIFCCTVFLIFIQA